VAWADQARKDIFYQRYGRDGKSLLANATNVSKTPATFSWLPRIVTSPSDPDRVYVLWQEIVFSGGTHGGEIFFASSSDAGKSFGQPTNLSNSIAGDGKGRLDQDTWDNGSLDLAIAPTGELYAAWTEYEGVLWLRRSADAGKSFSRAVSIGSGSSVPARGPSIAVAGKAVHVAWSVGDDRSANIHFATSNDGGKSFAKGQAVNQTPGHSDAPKIAVDASGTVHVAYAESPKGRGHEYHVRYTRRPSSAAHFEPARNVSPARTGNTGSAHYPHLCLDAKGTVYLLWENYLDSADRPRGLGFTYSKDRGEHFQPPSLIQAMAPLEGAFNGSQQGLLTEKLAVNAEGLIAVVNSTFRPETKSSVLLLRGRLEK
jgi:hypothetical protein